MASISEDTPVRIVNKYEVTLDLTDSDTELIKTEFNEKLNEYFLNMGANSLNSEKNFKQLLLMIKRQENVSHQDISYTHTYLGRYKFVKREAGKEGLLIKGKDGIFRVLLPYEEIFDTLWKTHLKYCHPTTETLKNILQNDYIVHDFAIQSIREVCHTCSEVKKPYYRIDLDILEMNGNSDFAFTHIMTCQDMFTGFIHIRPICLDNMESEICVELLRIFMDFGPPKEIVISSGIFEVALDQIKQLTTFAPISFAITRVHPNIDKLNRIRNLIYIWMKRNNFENWAIACYGVQLHLNNKIKGITNTTPFSKVFKNIESRVTETLPELNVNIHEEVSTALPEDFNATSPFSVESAATCSSASSEEVNLLFDETINGLETELKAILDDEMMILDDNDPLAIDTNFP